MLHSVIQQFLRKVIWGELDYLLIDLPPGTGDVALSLIQSAPLSGAVVVTTPSDVSLEDARKAVNMFSQVRVPILGMVENMSYLIAPGSGERIDVFGHGGGKRTAEQMGIAFLGELALDPEVRIGGDSGDAGDHSIDRRCARGSVYRAGPASGGKLPPGAEGGADGDGGRLEAHGRSRSQAGGLRHYILNQVAAVWSTPAGKILRASRSCHQPSGVKYWSGAATTMNVRSGAAARKRVPARRV